MPEPDSRARILSSIRESLDSAGIQRVGIAEDYAQVPREYADTSIMSTEETLALFEERLVDYDALVYHCHENEIAGSVAEILTLRGHSRLLVPEGLTEEWIPKTQGLIFVPGDDMDANTIAGFDGLVSQVSCGIAQTGSLVIQNVPGQGPRQLSLVPDYHLAIVKVDQVVENVPQAFARIAATAALPTTFISGPSATADIEMTRIKGVHGPRFLDVLLVHS